LIPSFIVWNEVIFESFQAGYLKPLDYDLCMALSNSTAKRLYRFLDKRFYHKPDLTFDLKELAHEHIGLSRNYEGQAHLKRKLQPAIAELEGIAFLEPLPEAERFQKQMHGTTVRFIKKSLAPATSAGQALTASQQPTLPLAEPEPSPLVAALVQRGVTRATAADLVQRHPAEAIEAKLDVFDWLIRKNDKRIARSPAGYLVKSIETDYAAPEGYLPREERRRREDAQQAKARAAAEDRHRQQDEAAREEAKREAATAYWATLTPPQQADLDAEMLAEASEEERQTYEMLKRMRAGDGYLKMMRVEYIHGILHRQPEPA
jgi:hypothetical protein